MKQEKCGLCIAEENINCKAVIEDLHACKSHLDDLAKLEPVLDGQLEASTEQVLEACKMLEQQMDELKERM